MCVHKVQLFVNEKNKKNRRFTEKEWQTELDICKWLKRPPRSYVNDSPFYPWLPPVPKIPKVNFDLNFKDK